MAITHTGANVHDSQQAIPLIDAIPPIKRPGGGRRKRPDAAFADRAYDAEEKIRVPLRERGMVAHGLGYSLLATRPASSMSYDGKALVTRPLRDQVPSGRLVLCQRRGGVLDRATSRFREHCISILKAASA